MRVLFIPGRELSYERNEVMLRALRRFAEVDVIAHVRRPRSLLAGSLKLIWKGMARLSRRKRRYDLLVVGFYGYPLVQVLARLTHIPVLFDAFVSNYDTLCLDRQVAAPGSPVGWLARWLDKSTCRLAEIVLLDTQPHVDFFVETYRLPAEKFVWLPVGCNEDLFRPQPPPPHTLPLRVLTYSSYMPLHGMDTVVQAAALLRGLPVQFRLIGAGPERSRVERLAAELSLESVEFVEPVAKDALVSEIGAAHICLGGHFGVTGKAGRVVPGKLYQMLAMARPVIAGATPANQAFLQDGQNALLVPPGDPPALAEAVQRLAEDASLRNHLAESGRATFEREASETVITERLRRIVGVTIHPSR